MFHFRFWVSLLLCNAAVAQAGGTPTRASLRKAFEANKPTLVEVIGPHQTGPGVLVGESGQVLTSVAFVGLEETRVRFEDQSLKATVLVANAELKVAVVAIDPAGHFPAAPVRADDPLEQGEWLVGVDRGRSGEPHPLVLQISKPATERSPFFEVNASLSPGAPLFNSQGKLVALAVSRRPHGARALPVGLVKLQLTARASAP